MLRLALAILTTLALSNPIVALAESASSAEAPWSLDKEADGIEVFTRPVVGSGIKEFKGVTVFDAGVAGDLIADIQFDVNGEEPGTYYLQIEKGTCTFHAGESPSPKLTIHTPSEVWLVGDSLNSCIDFFKSGDLVMCMSGSWQINGLAADVGDAFDWVVVPNPTGDGGSTGVAGGSAVVAFADTEYPEAVAALVEFLIQPENYSTFSAGTLILPAQTEVASSGVDFQSDNASVLAALTSFTAEIPKLQDQAVGLNVHPFAFAYYRNSANRVAQYLTGELSLDEALERLQQDIDDAVAEAEA